MSPLAAARLAGAGALLLCGLLAAGCGAVGGEDGAPSGLAWGRRVPVERFSGEAGEIIGASAEVVGPRSTLVFGRLRNPLGVSEVRDAHIDVKVLAADRRLIAAWTTDYFPRPILPEARGRPERAFFCVALPMVPVTGSIIQVDFHPVRLGECEFNRASSAGRP